ncbi:pyridoxal phosphate-dependent aminotransferase [Candidatus Thorarchaeota archaeon]|jgi:aspartate/methionine/tyrosine aminotransferase|nr:MAG: pyridoxal phosphate-dependent aminotransferase [Candidatus Thorarchaeota archaeon]
MLANRNRYVPASEIRKIFNMIVDRPDVLDLTLGIPDFDTPEHIKEAAKAAIDQGYTRYTHNAGYLDVREAVAEKLRRDNGIDADPKTEIMLTAGGMGALVLANLVLVDPGDEVLYPDPGFVSHFAHAALAQGEPVVVPLRKEHGFGMVAEDIESRITKKTKLLVLNSPNNPTGGVTSNREIKKIADLCLENDIYVLSDEAYEKFMYNNPNPLFIGSIPEMKEKVISIFSLSKTYAMTGWRIGACAGSKDIIGAMVKLQEHILAMPTSISQKAAKAAVSGPQDCVEEMISTFRKRRELITRRLEAIEGIEIDPPGGAFYVFPDVSAYGMKSYDLVLKILEETGVVTVHGSAFGEHGEGFLRLCYAVSTERIEEAMNRLEDFLPSLLK